MMRQAGKLLRLKQVAKLDLPLGEYTIFGSGPLFVRGLKDDMGDFDLLVTQKIWNKFKNIAGWQQKVALMGSKYLVKDDVELYKDWKPGRWNVKRLILQSEIIEGLPFVNLSEVLRWKKAYNRRKDQKDIQLILAYLKK